MTTTQQEILQVKTVALIGSYLPRRCGIATFTKELRDATANQIGEDGTLVLAMTDVPESYTYPPDVRFELRSHYLQDYEIASDLLNMNRVDVTVIQHEFGIFGGQGGSHILQLIRQLRMPTICTFHTVLKDPSEGEEKVIRELGAMCDRVVAMSELGVKFLEEIYKIPPGKIVFIPHGIPDVPFVDPSFYKDHFGIEGRKVLLTFGLLSPGKGIEYMIRAMPRIIEKHPDVTYIILGATHPHVLRSDGNAYRNSLERLVDSLGLQDHVLFQNRFVTLEELCGYLGATDIYVTPYLNEAQVTSGTLAYSMGTGKAVVSTPYWYAQEMLAENRGRLVPFRDSEALAEEVNMLLDNDVERDAMRKRAYLHCRSMIWKEVARSYLLTMQDILLERQRFPRQKASLVLADRSTETIPEIQLDHLRAMTDETGMLQHAIYNVPDRRHGYCTDDNARALIAVLRHHHLRRFREAISLANIYLAFLHHAFNEETERFRNFMSYDRRWLEEVGSEDSHGRALWGLGNTVAYAPNDGILAIAIRLFDQAVQPIETFSYPRSWAFSLLGIHAYLRRFSGDTQIRRIRKNLAEQLYSLWEANASADWPWPEDTVTYANAVLANALILSGEWLPDRRMLEQGLASLKWLLDMQTSDNGWLSPIGNRGWMTRSGERARFDQQPLEVMGLIEACAEAFRCTKDRFWYREARRCHGWFLGNNDIGSVLYDFKTGGCRDGLSPDGANENQGAESTLAWLISLATINEIIELEKRSTHT